MDLEMEVDQGVLGREGSVLHTVSWTSRPSRGAACCPAPEMKSFTIQTTQMKCHGKFDKNQEVVELTLGEGRGK